LLITANVVNSGPEAMVVKCVFEPGPRRPFPGVVARQKFLLHEAWQPRTGSPARPARAAQQLFSSCPLFAGKSSG
jgi:hypothetical protein